MKIRPRSTTQRERGSTGFLVGCLLSVTCLAVTCLAGPSWAATPDGPIFTNENPQVLAYLKAEGFVADGTKGAQVGSGRDLFVGTGSQCAGVIELELQSAEGKGIENGVGRLLSSAAEDGVFRPQAFSEIRGSKGRETLVVRGDAEHRVDVSWMHGTDRLGKPVSVSRTFHTQVACDEIVRLRFDLPAIGPVRGAADIHPLSGTVRLAPADVETLMGRRFGAAAGPAKGANKTTARLLSSLSGDTSSCQSDGFDGEALGAGWSLSYLGDADTGAAVVSGGRLTLSGNGTSLYHGNDNTVFLHRNVSGNYRAEVTITGVPQDQGGDYRKTGLMARFGSAADAPRVFVQYIPNHPFYNSPALQFDYRGADGVARELASTPVNIALPVRLALDRRGDLFTVYFSHDGGNSWIVPAGAAGGSVSIPGADEMQVGVNVASYDAATLMTTEFDDFRLCLAGATDPSTPPPPGVCRPGQTLNVAYLLDTSGSMVDAYPGADSKLDAARQAIYAMNASLAANIPGSAASLVTFAGNREQDFNLNISTKIRVSLTEDLAQVDQSLASIDPGIIDPASSTPLAIALAKTLDDMLLPLHDTTKVPVVIMVTDTIPNVDREGYGPVPYLFDQVSGISLYDAGGNFRSRGDVAWSGGYNGSIGTYDGKVLADVMYEVERIKAALPDTMIFGVAIQGAERFREDLMEYAAYYTGGGVYSVGDAGALSAALQQLVSTVDCGSTLGDRVWHDLDGNGEQNTGEPGLPGVTVQLLDAAGTVMATEVTDADGLYGFTGILAGTYTVRVSAGSLPSSAAWLPTFDLDGLASSHSATVAVTEGEDRDDVDFGYKVNEDTPEPGCAADGFADGSLSDAWSTAAIGDDDLGSAVESGGRLRLSSNGSELYHGDDNGFFVYQDAVGEIRAEVELIDFPVDGGGNHRKAGLVLRAGTAPDAARVMVMVEPHFNGGGPAVLFDTRLASGQTPVEMGSTVQGVSLPVRLMIERRDGVITVGISGDGGLTWLKPAGGLGGTAVIPELATGGAVGMMAASYSPITAMTAEFDDFSLCRPDTTVPDGPGPVVCDSSLPIDVFYVLDQSGSMTWEFPGDTSKFQASKSALKQLNAALSAFGNGSRAGLVTFSGKNDVDYNLNHAVRVRSELTDDFGALDQLITGLTMTNIPWQASTPVPLTLKTLRELLAGQSFANRRLVVIKFSDALANVDIYGEGPEEYDLEALQAISLKDASGNWLAPGVVAWSGNYHGSTQTYTGQPLADTMEQVHLLRQTVPQIRMFGLTLMGDGMGLGTYSFDMDQYAAYYTNGEARTAESADELTFRLVEMLQSFNCGEPGAATVGDRVWHDADGDGNQDPDELGIGGVTVSLVDVDNNVVATTVTESTGGYLFTDVPPGTYVVVVDPLSLPSELNKTTFDFDGTASPHKATVTVQQYQVQLEVDFGYQPGAVDPGDPVVGCVSDDFENGLSTAWETATLGNADQGGVTIQNGVLKVSGDGTAMFSDDHGFFVYRSVNNSAFRVEVDILGSDQGGATIYRKTGLNVRAGLGSLAPRVYIQYQPLWPDARGSLQFRYRNADGTDGGATWIRPCRCVSRSRNGATPISPNSPKMAARPGSVRRAACWVR